MTHWECLECGKTFTTCKAAEDHAILSHLAGVERVPGSRWLDSRRIDRKITRQYVRRIA